MFGASLFEKNGIIFSPRDNIEDLECQKRSVKIYTPVFAPFVRTFGLMALNPHRQYTEWVIGCTASPNKGDPVTFYISRGLHHNTIFTYTETRDRERISVYGYFNNVSVAKGIDPEAVKLTSVEQSSHAQYKEENSFADINLS